MEQIIQWLMGFDYVARTVHWFSRIFERSSKSKLEPRAIQEKEQHKTVRNVVGLLENKTYVRDLQLDVGKDGFSLSAAVMKQQDNNFARVEEKVAQKISEAEIHPLNPDWFMHFHEHAKTASTEEVQEIWARILAGELKQPDSFSYRTLETLKSLTQSEAQLFKQFCSMCFVWRAPNKSSYALLPSFWGSSGTNALKKFGFPLIFIKLLVECGLVVDEDLQYSYKATLDSNKQSWPFEFHEKLWLLHDKYNKYGPDKELWISGVALSGVGFELLQLVDREPINGFAQAVEQGFLDLGLKMVEAPPAVKRAYWNIVG